jgi:hypothetical protein
MKINPEKKEELKLDVKGYGCWDDCQVLVSNNPIELGCGWKKTARDSIFN